MQNQTTTATTPCTIFTKKIGQTTYRVHIHFSKTAKENFHDKLLRIIKNDIAKNAEAG